MTKKRGDRPTQGVLDESMRIPPSSALVEDTLAEIGAPQPALTARILKKAGISLIPVETPKQLRARAKPEASAFAPSLPPSSRPPPAQPPAAFWSMAGMRGYGKDCTYALAVSWGSKLLGWLLLVALSGLTFNELGLIDRLPDVRTVFSREFKQAPPAPSSAPEQQPEQATTEALPDGPHIVTGSIEPSPPPPSPPPPWQVETTIYRAPVRNRPPLPAVPPHQRQ